MNYLIDSLIRTGKRQFVPLSTFGGPFPDARYIYGAILWRIGDQTILSEEHCDLINQLWCYIVDGVDKVQESGSFETFFPDQPLFLSFRRVGQQSIEVKVGDVRHVVDREAFLASLAEGGQKFFSRMQTLLSERSETWTIYADQLKRATDRQSTDN
jgi:hypothetical protein